jgi:hypothetical protein
MDWYNALLFFAVLAAFFCLSCSAAMRSHLARSSWFGAKRPYTFSDLTPNADPGIMSVQ